MITRGKGLKFLRPCRRCGNPFRRTGKDGKYCVDCITSKHYITRLKKNTRGIL